MLTDIIPGVWRRRVYAAFLVIGAISGAVQVAYIAMSAPEPVWLTVTLAVLAFFGIAPNALAKANVNPDPVPQRAITPAPVAPSVMANADGTITVDPGTAAPGK